MKNCPYCAEEIKDEAIKCKHCGEMLNKENVSKIPPPSQAAAPLTQPSPSRNHSAPPSQTLIICACLGVIFLILILCVLLIPHFERAKIAKKEEQRTYCMNRMKNIGTGLEMWSTDNDGKYPDNLSEITPKYLKTIPTCPTAGYDTYSSSYQHNSGLDLSSESYVFSCSEHNIKYSSSEGLIY